MQERPRASALGDFAKALATHYDGNNGGPEAHVFQVWNEPNVSLYLNPVKASTYRTMVNAFAASVHAVDRRNIVVAGALDPFGHKRSKKQSWNSVAPARVHALGPLPLQGRAPACDVPQRRALRRLVAPSVHVRRSLREGEGPG